MNANVFGKLTRPQRPRGRAALALLPGVFALMLAGVSSVAAARNPGPMARATQKPTPTTTVCRHGTGPDGKCCPNSNNCITKPPPSPPANPAPSGSGGSPPKPTPTSTAPATPTAVPTRTPTSTPVTSSSGSGGNHSSGGSAAGATGVSGATRATHTQASVDPTPFAPLTSAVTAVTSGQGLDAARIPPIEALTPLSGLAFGNGLNLGPILLLIDLIGIGMLVYLVRTRWLAPEA
jgi:hypothetical protein